MLPRKYVRAMLSRLLILAGIAAALLPVAALAQNESGGADAGTCTLKDHVYTCNGAAFQAALAGATTVGVETHNSDGVARNQLTELLTKKMGKTVAADGSKSDLIFLLMPIDPSGVVSGMGDVDLGTLRVYSPAPDGSRGHLLWAETFSGPQDMVWPAVVHGLILQFQARFHIR
jgi:hypothetical protein